MTDLMAGVRSYLSRQEPDFSIGTAALVEKITFGGQPGENKALFEILRREATGALADCASRGEPKELYGKIVRPWIWHPPGEPNSEAREKAATASDRAARLAAAVVAYQEGRPITPKESQLDRIEKLLEILLARR